MCYKSENNGCSIDLQAVLRVANGGTLSENIAVKSFRFSPPTPFAVVNLFQGRLYFNYNFSKIPLGLRNAAIFFHNIAILVDGVESTAGNFSGPEANSISQDVAIPQGGNLEIRGTIARPFFRYTGTAAVTIRVTTRITDSLGNTTPTGSEYVFTSCDLRAQGPTASFEHRRDDEGGRINFTDTSIPGSAPIVSWFWEFEEGATSTEQNPSYRYTTPGEKSVRLTVTDSLGNSNIALLTGLEILASNFAPPTVNFSLQRSGALELTITDLSQAGAQPYTLEVNWGDGNTEAIPAGDSVVHVYGSGATRPVTLTATDQAGNVVARTLRYALPYDGPQPLGPVADFSRSNPSGNTYQFTDESQPSNTGDQTTMGTSTIAVWQWDFGDGNTSTEQNPEHTYTTPGTYYPKLRVVDANGIDSTRFTINPITISA